MSQTFERFPFLESKQTAEVNTMYASSVVTENKPTPKSTEVLSSEAETEDRLVGLIQAFLSKPDIRLFSEEESQIIINLILSNPTISTLTGHSRPELKRMNSEQLDRLVSLHLRNLDILDNSRNRIQSEVGKKNTIVRKIGQAEEIKIIEEDIDFI